MDTVVAVVRKWGNSKGVVLPNSLQLKEGEEILMNIQKTKGVAKVKDLLGKLKNPSKNLDSDLKKIDEELDIKW